MAGAEVNLYAIGDVDLEALMNTVDLQRVTYQGLSLTNYDNTALPAIAAGSLAEVAGTLFKLTVEEAITGWGGVAVGAAYIKLVPAGTDPDTVTAEFTDTAPTWSDAKQGWYGTAAAANHKYIGGLHRVDAATYYNKYLITKQVGFVSGLGFRKELIDGTFLKTKIIEIGDWNMDANTNKDVTHGLEKSKIRRTSYIIRDDNDTYMYAVVYVDGVGTSLLGIAYIDATVIRLTRVLNSTFDSVDFDSTTYNRGWVTIYYEA